MRPTISLIIILFMCSCGNNYYDFTDEDKALFIYEEGDIFKMELKPEMDTVTFEISKIEFSYTSTQETNYYQMYENDFISNGDLEGGFYCDLSNNGRFVAEIFIRMNHVNEFAGSLCDTLYNYNLNGTNYPELFVFAEEKGKSPILYFTKEEGIVYIDSTASGNSLSLIEFIKN